jgi:hypothetical protein
MGQKQNVVTYVVKAGPKRWKARYTIAGIEIQVRFLSGTFTLSKAEKPY